MLQSLPNDHEWVLLHQIKWKSSGKKISVNEIKIGSSSVYLDEKQIIFQLNILFPSFFKNKNCLKLNDKLISDFLQLSDSLLVSKSAFAFKRIFPSSKDTLLAIGLLLFIAESSDQANCIAQFEPSQPHIGFHAKSFLMTHLQPSIIIRLSASFHS